MCDKYNSQVYTHLLSVLCASIQVYKHSLSVLCTRHRLDSLREQGSRKHCPGPKEAQNLSGRDTYIHNSIDCKSAQGRQGIYD